MKNFKFTLGIIIGAILASVLVVMAVEPRVFFPFQGGTGTSTTPTLGQVLVGQTGGIYAPQATSTLGLGGGITTTTPPGSNLQIVYNNDGSWAGTSTLSSVNLNGHVTYSGINASTTSCGTLPDVVGNDSVGTVTIGTGIVTACTLTCATQYINAPVCVMTINTSAVTGSITDITTSSVTFSFSATVGGGQIYYHCLSR